MDHTRRHRYGSDGSTTEECPAVYGGYARRYRYRTRLSPGTRYQFGSGFVVQNSSVGPVFGVFRIHFDSRKGGTSSECFFANLGNARRNVCRCKGAAAVKRPTADVGNAGRKVYGRDRSAPEERAIGDVDYAGRYVDGTGFLPGHATSFVPSVLYRIPVSSTL